MQQGVPPLDELRERVRKGESLELEFGGVEIVLNPVEAAGLLAKLEAAGGVMNDSIPEALRGIELLPDDAQDRVLGDSLIQAALLSQLFRNGRKADEQA